MFNTDVLGYDSEGLSRIAARRYQISVAGSEHSERSAPEVEGEEKAKEGQLRRLGRAFPFARGVSLRLRIA